jgi:hypothetical protein
LFANNGRNVLGCEIGAIAHGKNFDEHFANEDGKKGEFGIFLKTMD